MFQHQVVVAMTCGNFIMIDVGRMVNVAVRMSDLYPWEYTIGHVKIIGLSMLRRRRKKWRRIGMKVRRRLIGLMNSSVGLV
jgi:hypothetical protein